MNPLQPSPAHARAIANWLLACLALVALMVAIGGITRLSESGLSIVEWKLVSGTLPPMSEPAWQAEFDSYKHSPQFLKVNSGFSLTDFKGIFWLEYLHRLLGRIIGLTTLLPLAYFAVRRRLPRALLWRGVGIAALTGAQGTVGWLMVMSGLDNEPRVAPIKLAAHLLLAFALFCLILWTRWQVLGATRPCAARGVARLARAVFALTLLQIGFGALVAGLRAGLTYTSYPRMDGQWIPDGLYRLHPWWINHVESVLTVQFQHRMGALAVVIAIAGLLWAGWRHAPLRPALRYTGALALLQFMLGVATLLSVINPWLAIPHQLMALALLAALLRLVFLTPLDANQQCHRIPQ